MQTLKISGFWQSGNYANNASKFSSSIPKCIAATVRNTMAGHLTNELREEEFNSFSAHFVTLTYDTDHVPISDNGFMTLRKSDFQDYMKRLRKACSKISSHKLKYYACGEYGEQRCRPHFHAIVFNCPDSDLFASAWSLDGVSFGSVYVGTVTTDSVAYVLKYIEKDSFREKKFRHSRDDRQKEFSLMSKGLGSCYLDSKAVRDWHRYDLSRNYVVKRSGHRVAMPRYYRVKLYDEYELEQQRYIIADAIEKKELDDKMKHYYSRRSYSYFQKREFGKQRRLQDLKRSQLKRNAL